MYFSIALRKCNFFRYGILISGGADENELITIEKTTKSG